MQSAGNITLDGTAALIRKIIPFTFVFEFAGAALLAIRFIPEFGVLRGIYAAVFHAISAFCNAGFDLMGMRAPFSSLTAYVSDPLVSLTICMLIIIGGLGFLVWRDLVRCRFRWKRLQLHSKLVLTASGILLFGGWLLLLGFEWNASMADLSIPEKLLASFFQAVTPRTAGFNTVDLSKLSDSGNLLTDFLMLIGGSPAPRQAASRRRRWPFWCSVRWPRHAAACASIPSACPLSAKRSGRPAPFCSSISA